MLSVKQGIIKYHFLSLWYDLTWDWTQVSQAIGEHSNHYAILFQTIPFSTSTVFVYTQLNIKKTQFNLKQFSLAWVRCLNLVERQDPIRRFHSELEGTWERWQSMGILDSPKLKHLIISSHIQDTCWGGGLPLCRYAVGVFCSLSWLGQALVGRVTSLQICCRCILHPQPTGAGEIIA